MTLTELYFSFDGRIGRQTFWLKGVLLGYLFLIGIFIVAVLLDALVGAGGALAPLVMLVTIWPSLAVYAKRWHDRNNSGWWTLIGLIPIIGSIWMLIECGFLEGNPGSNRFGEQVY